MTIFTTPVIRTLFRWLFQIGLFISGWRVEDKPLPDTRKGVIVAVPHTSNWDFPVMMAIAFKLSYDLHWIGKASLFKGPLGPLARWLGGIPVDRNARRNLVEQVATRFKTSQELFIVIAPEGTRGQVGQWRSGFYHMAHQGGVPLILAHIDGPSKVAGVRSEAFYTTGDYDSDIKEIRRFYKRFVGIKAKRHSEIEEE